MRRGRALSTPREPVGKPGALADQLGGLAGAPGGLADEPGQPAVGRSDVLDARRGPADASAALADDGRSLAVALTKPEVVLARLEAVVEEAADYAAHAKAPRTLRAYRTDWQDFCEWCADHQRQPLPASPETVALYLADRARLLKVSTLYRRLSAISQAHQAARYVTPTRDAQVRLVFQGIRRTHGTAPEAKEPAVTRQVRAMVEALDLTTLLGLRDRALLLVGFAGAFRRSELVALDVADVAFTPDGVVVTLRRSKTDQEGEGRKIGLPYGSTPLTCPVRALQAWLTAAGITEGPVFRAVDRHGNLSSTRLTDQVVALVVKRQARKVGLDPKAYAGHSLRAGLATAAAQADVSERVIMAQTGHRSSKMVRRYIRDGNLFTRNAAAAVGL